MGQDMYSTCWHIVRPLNYLVASMSEGLLRPKFCRNDEAKVLWDQSQDKRLYCTWNSWKLTPMLFLRSYLLSWKSAHFFSSIARQLLLALTKCHLLPRLRPSWRSILSRAPPLSSLQLASLSFSSISLTDRPTDVPTLRLRVAAAGSGFPHSLL